MGLLRRYLEGSDGMSTTSTSVNEGGVSSSTTTSSTGEGDYSAWTSFANKPYFYPVVIGVAAVLIIGFGIALGKWFRRSASSTTGNSQGSCSTFPWFFNKASSKDDKGMSSFESFESTSSVVSVPGASASPSECDMRIFGKKHGDDSSVKTSASDQKLKRSKKPQKQRMTNKKKNSASAASSRISEVECSMDRIHGEVLSDESEDDDTDLHLQYQNSLGRRPQVEDIVNGRVI